MTLITAQLALGNVEDAVRFANHIDAVLCCAREVPLHPKKPGYHLPIHDGFPIEPAALDGAYHFLDEQLSLKHLVLVYCGHGTSRSASVLCGYLALRQCATPEAVLKSIRRLRPEVSPSRITFRSIETYARKGVNAREASL
jgi:protein-tyrosine phosphatase